MTKEDYSISNWRNNIEYLIIAVAVIEYDYGRDICYHIFDVIHKLSHIIEEREVLKSLVIEMIDAGVKVRSFAETQKLIHTRLPKTINHKNNM